MKCKQKKALTKHPYYSFNFICVHSKFGLLLHELTCYRTFCVGADCCLVQILWCNRKYFLDTWLDDDNGSYP